MQKAALFKILICSCLTYFGQGAALSQTTLGEIIEKTKQNKRDELHAPSSPSKPMGSADLPSDLGLAQPAGRRPNLSANNPAQMPALWSLNGVNDRWVAEVWYQEVVHRFSVVPGHALPGGWKVVGGDDKSLTLAKGKLIKTLYPPAPGSTGGEFAQIQKTMGLEASMISMAREIQAVAAPLSPMESQPAPNSAPVGASPNPNPSPAVQAAAQLPSSNK
jgi:hypothetical protein